MNQSAEPNLNSPAHLQAVVALQKNNALLQGVIDAISETIYLRDLTGRYLLVNRSGAEILGLPPSEIIGKTYADLFPAETAAQIQAEDYLTLTTGQTTKTEFSWVQNGVKRMFRSTRSAYRDGDGSMLGILTVEHEITERVQAEEALRASEENFRALFESMTQGVIYRDAEGKIVAANPAAEEIPGLTLDEVQGGKSVDPLWRATRADGSNFPGEEHPAMVALRTGEIQRAVILYVFNPRKQEQRCLQVDAVPQCRPGETLPYQVYTLIQDITEQRRADEERAFHAQLLRNIHDAVIATDVQFNITAWNQGAEQMYGWLAGEVLGHSVRTVIRSELDEADRQKAIQELQETGRYRLELLTHYRDGTPIPTEGVTVAMYDSQEQISGYLSINRDSTERKRSEEALRESAEQLRMITDNVPGLIAYIDREERYRFVNATYETWYGVPRAEILGQQVRNFVRPSTYAKAQPHIAKVLAGEPTTFEVETIRGDQPVTWLMKYTPRIALNGRVLGFYTLTTDITERKQIELALQELNETLERRVTNRTQQLQTSNTELLASEARFRQLSQQLMQLIEQERTRIAREIHDQLGQGLTAIKMELKAGQRRLDASQAATLARLQSAEGLIDETIQTVRRIATDLRPGVLDDFGLGAAVEWQMQQFQARYGLACHWQVQVDESQFTPVMATAAFRILQEALTNIIRHAQATEVVVSLELVDGEFHLGVRDNGRGMAETDPEKPSLGLLGMRERAEQVGGTIKLTSMPGQGTTVLLRLPVKRESS